MLNVPKVGHAGIRDRQQQTARRVIAFLAAGYGPHGGTKLVAGDEPTLVRGAALALRELPADPDLSPYQDLAARMWRDAGDATTTAVLLAARLVHAALDSPAGVPAFVQGYGLARRQALARLTSLASQASAAQALASATSGATSWAQAILEGLPKKGAVHLDDIEVLAEPGEVPHWLPGIPLSPQTGRPVPGPRTLLLLSAPWRVAPTTSATWHSPATGLQAEGERRRRAFLHLKALGVDIVACASAVDAGLIDLLADAGISVATDVPLSRMQRLAKATKAAAVARLEDASAADVGRGTITKRPRRTGGWLVQGSGPSQTLVMPGNNPLSRAAGIEDGERLLRMAGLVLHDSRVVPGGGDWQARVADSLRRSADAGPGRTPFALHAAAGAVGALADDLRRNSGGLVIAPSVDAYACVRAAVRAAFDCATVLLRVDARHDKRPSSTQKLRGGGRRVGSPRGLPGDNPPLM